MIEQTDEQLIELARSAPSPTARNEIAGRLFARHYQRVALWCLRWSDSKEQALDLTQEIFLKVHRSLDSFEGSSKFTTWLYMVARNHCINAGRANWSKETIAIGEYLAATLETVEPGPEKQAETKAKLELARQFLEEHLDDTERQVMLLHYVQELPLPVVTRMLKLTNASGAKAFMVSGQRKLKTAVERWRARGSRRSEV